MTALPQLDLRIKKIDPAWPVIHPKPVASAPTVPNGASNTKIHVNPNFVSKTAKAKTPPVVDETEKMREELLRAEAELIQQKSPSRPPQFEKKKELAMAGSPLCHLLQMAAFPRCAKLKAAPLRRRSGPLRNLQEVGRGQVAEREVEEIILTRSPGLRGSLSKLNWRPMTPLGRLRAPRLVGASTRRRTPISSAPRLRRRHPGTGKRGRRRIPEASGAAETSGATEIAGLITEIPDGGTGVVQVIGGEGVAVELCRHLVEVVLSGLQYPQLLSRLVSCSPTWRAFPQTSLPLTLR